MLDVSRAMFEEPDAIFCVDNREHEAWGNPAPMANNNGWGYVPLSHLTRCRAVSYTPPFSLHRLMPPAETYSRSQRLARPGQSSFSTHETQPRYGVHSNLPIHFAHECVQIRLCGRPPLHTGSQPTQRGTTYHLSNGRSQPIPLDIGCNGVSVETREQLRLATRLHNQA